MLQEELRISSFPSNCHVVILLLIDLPNYFVSAAAGHQYYDYRFYTIEIQLVNKIILK